MTGSSTDTPAKLAESLDIANKPFDEMTVDEFGRVLEASGFVRLEGDEIAAAARRADDAGERDGSLEAFGTGIQGHTESTDAQIEASQRAKAARPSRSDDRDDYTTGVQGEELADREQDMTREARKARELLAEGGAEDLEAFGTGVAGDTTAEDDREREERVEVLAEALERALDDE